MTRRNTRIFNIAHVALYRTTYRVADAIDQLEAERVRAVSGPDKGESAGRSSDPTSTAERNGCEAARLDLLIDNLKDAVDGFDIAHRYLLELAEQACRTRAFGAPIEATPEAIVCKHGQLGKAGAIEWGDVTCDKAPVKMDLCSAHYQAYYRYRKEHGRDTSKDFAA